MGDVALEVCQKQYKLCCSLLGQSALQTLTVLKDLLVQLKEYDPFEGIRLARELVLRKEEIWGPNHEESASAWVAVARCQFEADDFQNADESCRHAISMMDTGGDSAGSWKHAQYA